MESESRGELAVLSPGFDYALIADEIIAEQVRSAADRIRQLIRMTLSGIIEIGKTLWEVKEALPHGEFGNWVMAEFGWRPRSVQNFMAVAAQFGKYANFADLPIQPSAAYVLAAPSVPGEARRMAITRAEAGERITVQVAREILSRVRKETGRSQQVFVERLARRVGKVLDDCRKRYTAAELEVLTRELRKFVEAVDEPLGSRNGHEEEEELRTT